MCAFVLIVLRNEKILSVLGLIILFVIIPLSMATWPVSQPERGIGAFFGTLLGMKFLCLVAYGLWNCVTMGTSINIEQAAKHNGLAPSDLYFH